MLLFFYLKFNHLSKPSRYKRDNGLNTPLAPLSST